MFASDRDIKKKLHISSVLKRKYRNQLLAAIVVQIITFAHGIAIGWTSPTLLKLQSDESPTNFIVSVEQASWIGSLSGLGSLVGNLFGFLLNRIGRKWCLYLIAMPYIMAWILTFFSKTYVYLYVARFLIGVTGGGIFLVIPIFISEIADASLRGTLSSLLMLFLSFGIMVGFVLSSQLDYYLNSCIIITFPILYLVALTIFPETPQFLLRKQQIDKAREAFKFYKNSIQYKNIERNTTEQQKLNADGEFEELKSNILTNHNSQEKLLLKEFVSCAALKTFFTAFVLMALSQFSGSLAFLIYMSDIFAHSGTDIHPNTCTILMGVAQIVGAFSTVILVDRFGRKLLMLVSSGGMAVGLLSFGFYIQFTSAELKLVYNWVPIVIMTFVVIMVNIAVTGLLIVEIFPAKIRAPAATICSIASSLMVFAALKIFPLILQNYGLANLLFFCGGVSVIGGLYVLLFLKETKGISMDR